VTEPTDSINDGPKLWLVTQGGVEVDGKNDRRPPNDPPFAHKLEVGSDVEIARRLVNDLSAELGEIHWVEGKLWFYCGTHWVSYPKHQLRLAAYRYDGALYRRPGRKNDDLVQLSKPRIDGILHELATLLAEPGFFLVPAIGINCKIRVSRHRRVRRSADPRASS
jgi:hypothetical protein